jgi:hypothetical protein
MSSEHGNLSGRSRVGETLQGLGLWISAALVGAFGCTFALNLAQGGNLRDLPIVFGIGLLTLIFTLAGSGLLTLAFASMGQWSLTPPIRYGLLIVFGASAGVLLGGLISVTAGFIYGTATSLCWVMLHLLIYRRR